MLLRCGVFFFTFLVHSPTIAETVNTPQIISRTLSAWPSCLEWRVVGQCIWEQCNLLGCSTTTSPKVSHYIPDFTVVVYQSHESFPWQEAKRLLSDEQKIDLGVVGEMFRSLLDMQGAGQLTTSVAGAAKRNLRFFEAAVIGHPGIAQKDLKTDLLCQATTEPLNRYYTSRQDPVRWRGSDFSAELVKSTATWNRRIGNQQNFFGTVYPRTGFIHQPSPSKAAAVIAHRACDILLNGSNSNSKQPIGPPNKTTWIPQYLHENQPTTGLWQMVSPKVDRFCELFSEVPSDWDRNRTDADQSFIWNLWRRTKCCVKKPGILIAHVDF